MQVLKIACALLSVVFRMRALAQCPSPFNLEAGKCVYVNTAQSYSWCSANQQCASIGGELISSYESLKLLGSMPSVSCSCQLWVGVSDMADERFSSKSGWRLVNGKGILAVDYDLWFGTDPNNMSNNQDCVGTDNYGYAELVDLQCSALRGFACEFDAASQPQSVSSAMWRQTPFKATSYNNNAEYCFTDVHQVVNSMHCMAAALRAGNSRHVLYNSKLRTCRLLQFTDAQVEQEIETSPDWVKFSF